MKVFEQGHDSYIKSQGGYGRAAVNRGTPLGDKILGKGEEK